MNYGVLKSFIGSRFTFWGALFILCFATALIGLGRSYQSTMSPQNGSPALSEIRGDGWVTDGAVIPLSHLASQGNRLVLQFDAWRPEALDPAQIRVDVC